MTVDTRTY